MNCLALVLLAIMVQSEAGSEPYDGKLAVAYVAMNRVEQGMLPGEEGLRMTRLITVLQQSKQFALNPRLKISESTWLAAHSALNHTLPDPTGGADHFYARAVKPWPAWYDERYITVRIGRHDFLKLGGY